MVKLTELSKTGRYTAYQIVGFPEIFHIIKTGCKDQYFLIEENGYEDQNHGKCIIKSKQELEVSLGKTINF